nr:hypothetical protein [Flavobacterium sp.]
MFSKLVINFKKKSPSQRFLFVIGILFFVLYLVLGLIVIFWQAMPIVMPNHYRIAFGLLLIVYSFFRFARFFNANS